MAPADLLPDGKGGVGTVVCFCAGTRIATPAGEVPVERLAVGDLVLTHRGEARRSSGSAPAGCWRHAGGATPRRR